MTGLNIGGITVMIVFNKLNNLKAFLFDLDGCIYYGNLPASGATQLLEALHQDGIQYYFLTNNSTHSSYEIACKLQSMGLLAKADQVITATELSGIYILDKYGIKTVKVVGSDSLRSSVEAAGHRILDPDADSHADIILVGRDVHFTYDKLQRMAEEAMHGSLVVSTNPDAFHLGSSGEIVPETGSITAALESIIGCKIEYIGKPGPFLFEYVLREYGLKKQECVMVGDNLMTDIVGGISSGLHTIWVKGKENRFVLDEKSSNIQPDLTVTGIQQLLDIYLSTK
jgi:HAD superfamily hydrolase (TIGR01450 family)